MTDAPSVFGSDHATLRFLQGDRVVKYDVRGLQVGRFFVRGRIATEGRATRVTGAIADSRAWFVTHLNTGISWTFASLSVALFVADQVSLHARVDPSSTDRYSCDRLRKQLGKELWAWLESLSETADSVPSFPEWRAAQKAE